MKRGITTSLAVLLAWWGIGVDFASAQFGTLGQPPIRPRPSVSPYINLGTGGGAMSYYGIVRPQIDANKSILGLQNALSMMNPDGSLMGQLDQQSQTGQPNTGLSTGHSATYFNYGHYYPQYPPGGAGTAGFGGGLGGGGFGPGMGGYNSSFGPGSTYGGSRTFFGNTMGTSGTGFFFSSPR